MHPEREFSDDDIKRRFKVYYGEASRRNLSEGQIPFLRNKWASLSEYVKEIKQTFSRYYNRLHNRRGFFWGDRFKSVIVDNGDTLINCLAYIDLNPVRPVSVRCQRTTASAPLATTSSPGTRTASSPWTSVSRPSG
jgi:hypothetical protein